MIVRRVIEKEVKGCRDCPYYREDRDMGCTMVSCGAIDTIYGSPYDSILNDINWRNAHNTISVQCPLTKQENSDIMSI